MRVLPAKDVIITYNPVPTLRRFHNDDSYFRGIMGPIGSGKSAGCSVEILKRAAAQQPNSKGIRPTRIAVCRQSYPMLISTTIKTFQKWVPHQCSTWNMGSPITCKLKMRLDDGTLMDCEVWFFSLARPRDREKLMSLELTMAWVNEGREFTRELLDDLSGRLGRYPDEIEHGVIPTWVGYWGDTNPPDTEHWWYRMAELTRPPDHAFFRQPAALLRKQDGTYVLNPRAENIGGLPLGARYYFNQLSGRDREWLRVYIEGSYGYLFEGRPVYQDVYSDEIHLSPEPLAIYSGIPVLLGWDFGLTPACVVAQQSPRGQLRILREYQCESGPLRQFVEEVVRPALNNEFPGAQFISRCDPSIKHSEVDGQTCLNELLRLGYPTVPAPTNDFVPRRDAVMHYMLRTIDGQTPAFILDPSVVIVRQGCHSGYQYRRIQLAGYEKYALKPDKNTKFSHTADCVQYIASGLQETAPIAEPRAPRAPVAIQEPTWGSYG